MRCKLISYEGVDNQRLLLITRSDAQPLLNLPLLALSGSRNA